jgi:hypothetical protein
VKGRFLERDPLEYTDGMNLYEYAKSNPITFADPNGMDAAVEKAFNDMVKNLDSDKFVERRVAVAELKLHGILFPEDRDKLKAAAAKATSLEERRLWNEIFVALDGYDNLKKTLDLKGLQNLVEDFCKCAGNKEGTLARADSSLAFYKVSRILDSIPLETSSIPVLNLLYCSLSQCENKDSYSVQFLIGRIEKALIPQTKESISRHLQHLDPKVVKQAQDDFENKVKDCNKKK